MSSKILVPIDLEHESSWKNVLPQAVKLAEALEGKIHVMTVVPHVVAGIDWRYAMRGDTAKIDVKDLVKQARKRLEELTSQHIPEALRGGIIAAHGTVYQEIVEKANEIDANLIVMASHRPSLKDFLLGPNAARVARHAQCSVHIVRES